MGTLLSIGNEQDGACRSSARQMEWKGKGEDRLVRALIPHQPGHAPALALDG
jgi:hypothetical protein